MVSTGAITRMAGIAPIGSTGTPSTATVVGTVLVLVVIYLILDFEKS
jgi:hypothetical protein